MKTLRLKEFICLGSSFVVRCNKRDLTKIVEYFKINFVYASVKANRLALKKYVVYISFGSYRDCCTKRLSSFSKEIKKITSRDGVVLVDVRFYCFFQDTTHSNKVVDFDIYLVPSRIFLNNSFFCKQCNNTNVYTKCSCYNISI